MIGRHALHLTKEPYECPLTTCSTEPAGTGLRLGARHGGGPVNLVLVGLVRLIQSLAVCVFLWPISVLSDETAEEVLGRMTAAYASLRSYSDTGVVLAYWKDHAEPRRSDDGSPVDHPYVRFRPTAAIAQHRR